MNTKILSTKLSWTLIIFFMSGILASTGIADNNQQCKWTAVEQKKFAEILTMINSRVEENYDRIKTWQGKVNIVIDNVNEAEKAKRLYEKILVDKPVPNEIVDHVELTKEFALDVNKGLLYDNIYPDSKPNIIDAQTGRNLRLNDLVHIGSGENILTPDYQLSCREYKNREGTIVRRTVIKKKRPVGEITCQDNLRPVFDPRETMRIFGDIKRKSFAPLGGTFAKYLAFFDKEGGHNIDGYPTITVEECNVGDVKKYRITLLSLSKDANGARSYATSTLICSSEAGFNVVSYSNTGSNGKILENKMWDYGLIDGVYIPVRQIKQGFDYQTGNLTNHSTISFIGQKVNNPISDEVFTYKNLGLKDGDKFVDKIAGKEYKYQDANLVPITSAGK